MDSTVEVTKSNGGILNDAGDFFRSMAYSAVQMPINGIEQIVNAIPAVHLPPLDLIDAPKHDSLWTGAGKLTGAVADFVLLQKGLSTVAPGVFAAAATTPIWLRSGMTGTAYQLFMPVSDNGNFFLNKTRDLGIGFGTFAAMGYAAQIIAPKLGTSLLGRVEAGAGEGIAAGGADAALSDVAYMEAPSIKNLRTVGKYAAFGAMLGATDYLEDTVKAKLNASKIATQPDQQVENAPEKKNAESTTDTSSDKTEQLTPEQIVEQSIKSNQQIFQQAGETDSVVPAQKQLYNVQLRKVTAAAGEQVPTLENPGGELVKQGDWVATRLDTEGQPVLERGQVNQWPIVEKKIPKTYNVEPAKLQSETELVAPTRVDGPPVHVVQLKEPLTIHTPWGHMNANPGDWLANYDFNTATSTPGTDFAIISSTSFGQTYKF